MAGEHGNPTIDQLKTQFWQSTGADKPLGRHTNFQSLFDAQPNRGLAFAEVPNTRLALVCIDDRIIPGRRGVPDDRNYVHMGGEGILNPNAVADLLAAGVGEIRPHRKCGAKALFAPDADDPDEVGLEAVRKISREADIPITGIIDGDEFPSVHPARVVYYDGTARFHPTRLQGFPPGFVVSRSIISPEYAAQEVAISHAIAMGHHGLGSHFSEQAPFYLVAVSDTDVYSLPVNQLRDELESVAKNLRNVEVDTLEFAPRLH